MAGVILERVSRVYPGGVTAVSELDLEAFDREFLVLVGPSGCGKSTTLRMIAGLEPVSAGRIRIAGQVVNDTPPGRRNIAMVFQGQALYPHWTVYKNLAFGLELRRRSNWLGRCWQRLPFGGHAARQDVRREIDGRVRSAAALLGIETLLARLPSELSGGERQRAALGRAMVRQPNAFLFDEPLSNLDAQLRAEMRRELKKLGRQVATTVIYVTHDQAEALTLGDRIAVLDRGRLQQLAAPAEVYDWPANRFVAGFIGSPPMNLVEGGWIQDADGAWRFVGGGWSVRVAESSLEGLACQPGRPVVFGLRPEHLRLAKAGGTEKPAEWLPAEVTATDLLGDAIAVELQPTGSDGEAAGSSSEFAGGGAQRLLLCKTSADAAWSMGDQVLVGFDMRRAHWFDAQTGQNLCRPGGVRG
ncbi:MAG TPA: ABC transporter ATP-binding protein [Pirellulales bacterium]|nr:ABC transporter ATP-binding protein [Pirellulales bacterium]